MVERATVGVFEPTTYQGAFVYPVIGYEKNPKTKKPDLENFTRSRLFSKLRRLQPKPFARR